MKIEEFIIDEIKEHNNLCGKFLKDYQLFSGVAPNVYTPTRTLKGWKAAFLLYVDANSGGKK